MAEEGKAAPSFSEVSLPQGAPDASLRSSFVINLNTNAGGRGMADDDQSSESGMQLLVFDKTVSVTMPHEALLAIPYLAAKIAKGGALARRSSINLNLPNVKFLDAFVEVVTHCSKTMSSGSASGSLALDLRPQNQFQLYSVAAMLQLEHLIRECESFISAKLCTASFLFAVQHAVKLKRPSLLRVCYAWLCRSGGISYPPSHSPLLVDVANSKLVHAKNSLSVKVFEELATKEAASKAPWWKPLPIDAGEEGVCEEGGVELQPVAGAAAGSTPGLPAREEASGAGGASEPVLPSGAAAGGDRGREEGAAPQPVMPLGEGHDDATAGTPSRRERFSSWGHSPARLVTEPGWCEEVAALHPEPYDAVYGEKVKGFAGMLRCTLLRHRGGLESRDLPAGWDEWAWEIRDLLSKDEPGPATSDGRFLLPFGAARSTWWEATFGTEPVTWFELRRVSDDSLVLVAISTPTEGKFLLSRSSSRVDWHSQHYLGCTECNFIGTTFSVYDHGVGSETPGIGESFSAALPAALRKLKATVTYATNLLARAPNSFELSLEDGRHMASRHAVWSERVSAWTMDFKGRARKPSKKNFQIVDAHDVEAESPPVYLVFGKLDKDVYALDFRAPLSPALALAIALSAFASKAVCA